MHVPDRFASRPSVLALSLLAGFAAITVPAMAAEGEPQDYADVRISGSILEPKPVVVSDDAELASHIKVPDGFKVEVVARDLINPRMIAVSGKGEVYVTRRSVGDVIHLIDADGDGKFEKTETVAARPGMHGIAFDGDTVFLETVRDVYRADVNDDGSFGELTRIIDDLPDGGQHANRTLAVGPDGMLYMTAGSTCNECQDSNPENATMLRGDKDGKSRAIFASGLRNTIGFGWEPETGELYAFDQGIDWLGDEEQQEEFNHLQQGKKYGWPYVFDFSHINPHSNPPQGITSEDWVKDSIEPVLGYTAHGSAMQMAFYDGTSFPQEYRGDAFIAFRGSWNRRPPSGYEVARVVFEDHKPVRIEHFAQGFLIQNKDDSYGFLGRPTGLAVAKDGSLLISDDANGVLYRISYSGETAAAETNGKTAEELDKAAPNLVPTPPAGDLAINLVKPSGDSKIEVTAGFPANGDIPIKYARDGHDASPMLAWSGAPEATKSFAIVIDDPDAAQPKPFVHWVLYDLPADVTQLHEGLSTDPILQDPKGAKQGANSANLVGYHGPKPPAGDPPHHYHIQVLATDMAETGLKPGATKQELMDAIKGHVLATGEIVGTYQRPAPEKPAN